MADNVELSAGSGGATIKTDDDGTAHWQYVKLAYGADNTQTRVTSAAPLPVDGSGVTQPVSGTVTANLGATDNAVLDAIAASLAGTLTVDLSTNNDVTLATLPDTASGDLAAINAAVSGTLTVGSHAVTNAGTFAVQAAQSGTWTVNLGTAAVTNAGTFAVQVDGSALTALQLIDDAVYVDDADWTDGVSKHMLVGGLYQSTPQTITDGDVGPLSLSSDGALRIHDGGNTITVDGTITANAGTNLNTSALAVETGGNLAACATSLGTIDNAISGNEMQVDVVGALPAGTNNIGDVDVLSIPRAASHYRNIDANAEAEIKGSAGTLYWLHAMNLTAAKAYVHLYDATAANVTPGTTTPNYTFPLPTQGDTNGAGFVMNFGATGQTFASGITLVVTTTIDGSAGDPGTNGVFVNAGYT